MASPYVEREAASTRTEANAERDKYVLRLCQLEASLTHAFTGGQREALRYAIAAIEREKELLKALEEVNEQHINDDNSCGLCGSDDKRVQFIASEYIGGHEEWCPIRKVRTALRTQGGSDE